LFSFDPLPCGFVTAHAEGIGNSTDEPTAISGRIPIYSKPLAQTLSNWTRRGTFAGIAGQSDSNSKPATCNYSIITRRRRHWWKRHSLSLAAAAILTLWIVLYIYSSPQTHWGSFFGNAIADWTGLLLMVLATKFLYESGSAESKQPNTFLPDTLDRLLYRHSLSIFLIVTGVGWAVLFAHMDTQGKWGQVVGNIVSEWTQVLGVVLLTKKLIEAGSKESK
jgi:hypothetical protein